MDFTFGIITDGNNDYNIELIINSIEIQNIPNYEIVIVGNSRVKRNNTLVYPFNESIKPMWITKKKNIITQLAKYENIVYMHDYIVLDDGWYQGWLEYGNDFKACMNQILNFDGTRFRDWSLWAYDAEKILNSRGFLIPYDMIHLSKIMYFSGSYWVAKKEIMLKYPLHEYLSWGQGEDVEWSKRFRSDNDFSMNKYSIVKFLKQKDKAFDYSSKEDIQKLINIKL